MEIRVDEGVRKRIAEEGRDYRVCTSCTGPALVPTSVKPPKTSDIVVEIGGNRLYVSRVQANYIRAVTEDMFYDDEEIDACPVFYRR
ncbi:MAG: hypothetical protein LBG62_05385 [Candidatus Methanoplasma sp.]|jgi:hypothetical protein|nr:hypothetical protein [Candidatus Methanoplasma sp.]